MNYKLITFIVCLLSTLAFVLMVAYLPPAGKGAAGIAASATGLMSVFAFTAVFSEP